jgi:hypothetical protein
MPLTKRTRPKLMRTDRIGPKAGKPVPKLRVAGSNPVVRSIESPAQAGFSLSKGFAAASRGLAGGDTGRLVGGAMGATPALAAPPF